MSDSTQTLQQATQVHEGGDWVQAARMYSQIIETNPNHPEALHRFGILCQQIGKHSDAREMLTRAIANTVRGQSADYRVTLAISYLAEGRAAEALAECELARAESESPTMYLVQGRAFRQLNDREQAKACLVSGVEKYPCDVTLQFELGQTHFELDQWNDATSCFEQVLELDGKHSQAILRLTEMMLSEEIEIGDPWINRLRLALTYSNDESMRNELRRKLADCHSVRGESDHADAVCRQIRP